MTDTLPEGLRDKVAVALHDADCHDQRCDPLVMGAYYRQADVALATAADALRAQGAAAERERIRNWIAGEIVLNGPVPDGVTERIGPALDGDADGN